MLTYAALPLVLLSLPVFLAMLLRYPERRDQALVLVGVLLFCVTLIRAETAIITWPLWPGISKGILVGFIDTLCVALIATRTKPAARTHYLWPLWLYILPSTLSLFVSDNFMGTLFVPIQIARIILMVYALAGELHRPTAVRALFAGVSLGLMIQCGFVIQQKLSGVAQAPGTTDHQNILALMVSASLIPMFALILEGDRRKIVYAGFIAGLICVAGGGSRAAMALLPAGLVLLLVLSLIRNSNPHKWKIFGLLFLVSAVAVPLGLATLGERFGTRSMSTENDGRWAFERAARAMSADHPFGVGANNYVTVANVQGYALKAGVEWGGKNLSAPVHNSYLLMRAETGWFGEGVMLLVLLVPIVGGLVVAFGERRSPMAGMGLGVAVAVTTIAVHINFEYAWHLESVQRLFFMNFAILSGAAEACRRGRSQARRKAMPREQVPGGLPAQ